MKINICYQMNNKSLQNMALSLFAICILLPFLRVPGATMNSIRVCGNNILPTKGTVSDRGIVCLRKYRVRGSLKFAFNYVCQ